MNKLTVSHILLYSCIGASLFATTWVFWDILNYGEFCAIEPNNIILTLEFTAFLSASIIFPIYAYFRLKVFIDKEVEEDFKKWVEEDERKRI